MTETTGMLPEAMQYIAIWAESLAQVLTQASGAPSSCVALAQPPADIPPAAEDDLWMVCACSGGLRGEMSLRLPSASVLRLAQVFTGAPPAALTSEHREAVAQLLRQAAGLAASTAKAQWGEVQLRLEPAQGTPSWPASSTLWLRIGETTSPEPLVEVQLSAALAAALRAEGTGTASAAGNESPAATAPPNPGKLDLLMDVELAVTLRFGSRRLLLREILDLNPGAVIELDRMVQDPVDLLLDGRLLARGEVVVVDGNYGLRVTEMAPTTSL